MNRIATPLLGALLLASSAAAQDELPYHQKQRMVVIFRVTETLAMKNMWDNDNEVEVLRKGVYRFDAERRTQAVMTPENLADGTGPFVRYGSRMRGRIRPLYGTGTTRDAVVRLKMVGGDLSRNNVVEDGELEFEFMVPLGSMSTSQMRLKGDVKRQGPFVRGELAQVYTASLGKLDVWHVKLELEDHLPIRRPLAQFPNELKVSVKPTPKDEIEAGPFEFTLTRKELNPVGAVFYDSAAHFPMVDEHDYYGHYRSAPSRGELVIREDEKVHIELGWGLGGRYHGWSFDYVAVLTKAQFKQLENGQSVMVTGKASYHFASEDEAFDVETTAQLELELGAPAAPTTGSSGGLVGGVTGN